MIIPGFMPPLGVRLASPGGAPAWTPASATGLVGWYEMDAANLYQSISATPTTPVTAVSDPVGHAVDLSSAGTTLLAPAEANRPLYDPAEHITGNASSHYIVGNIASTFNLASTGATLALRFANPSTVSGVSKTSAHLGGTASANNGIKLRRLSNDARIDLFDGTNLHQIDLTNFHLGTSPASYVARFNASTTTLDVFDGTTNTENVEITPVVAFTINQFSLLARRNGGEHSNGGLRAAVAYNNPISDDDRTSLLAYLAAL